MRRERRGPGPGGRRACAAAGLALAALLAGCSSPSSPAPQEPDVVRVASFDFTENRLLAAIYAEALRRSGYEVVSLADLGPRETVAPALAQGLADLVPEYAGSALRFLTDSGPDASQPAGSGDARAALVAALDARGLTALAPAPGQDQNGVVVSRATAEQHALTSVSDLQPLAPAMVFGGPAECPERPLCLRGLQERYGLAFGDFVPMPSRASTAEALLAGQLDVGMLETIDPYLADGRLVLLDDDRQLQPAENVVPVVRQALLAEHGPALGALLDEVTATLTTRAMVELNRQVVLDERPVEQVAAGWVTRHGWGRTG